MHPARIAPLLCVNRALWEAEPPKARYCQSCKQCPEVPSAPHEARNSHYQQQTPDHSNYRSATHPAFCQRRRGDVPKSGDEQKTDHAPQIDSLRHAVIPTRQSSPIGSSSIFRPTTFLETLCLDTQQCRVQPKVLKNVNMLNTLSVLSDHTL